MDSTKKNRSVLLLNASYEVINVIDWQTATSLYYTGKAVAPTGYDHVYEVHVKNGVFLLPSALVLSSYVVIPYHTVRPTRRNIFRRDGYVCQYTGVQLNGKTASIDHVLPQSRGGKNTWENMVTAEKKTNQRKGDRTPKEAGLKFIDREPYRPTRSELVINAHKDMEPWQKFIN